MTQCQALDIDAAVRVGAGAASATVGASAPPVAVAGVVRLTVVASLAGVVLGEPVAVQPGQNGGEEKEDAVHDAEGETGLQKGTCFVGIDTHAIPCEIAKNAKVDVVGRARGDVRAICASDETEVVHSCDECSDKCCHLIGQVSEFALASRRVCDMNGNIGNVPRSMNATNCALALLLW